MNEFWEALPPLPTAAEMARWDANAIAFGIPENMLMENAARAIFAAACEHFGPFAGRPVCLFMGGGNNGGDAACLARHMADAGAAPVVFCLKDMEKLTGAAAFHAQLAKANGVSFQKLDNHASLPANMADIDAAAQFLAGFAGQYGQLPHIFVDGLIGSGFAGDLKPHVARLIRVINCMAQLAGKPMLAVDIPSGLNAQTGAPQPVAIRAAVTVTLAAVKPGLLMPCARPYAGKLILKEIGMPKAARRPASLRLLDGHCLFHLPPFPQNSYKNIYGHALVIGGAQGYAGAAHLACAGALRAGAGLVTACAPAAFLPAIKSGWPEIMTLAANTGDKWPRGLDDALLGAVEQADAIVIGPGMGTAAEAGGFLRAILSLASRPAAVIDADALNIIAQNPDILENINSADILTPHPGEAARLLGIATADVQADRPAALEALCALTPAVCVLKGAATLVGQGERIRLLCPYDIPELAIGGSGDVLAGCAGAILALRPQALPDAASRAAVAVMLHMAAGLGLARRYSRRGGLASNLADAIAHAREFVAAQPDNGDLPWPPLP